MGKKTELELQFDAITPNNLKENETISKLLEIYNSSFGPIREETTNEPLKLLDTDYLIEKYEETSNKRLDTVRKEIFKIHLQEIYQTFNNIEDSEKIFNKFKGIYEALDIPIDNLRIVADIDKSINSEYINAAGSFKTKKGTKSGFFFVYDIINKAGIQSLNGDSFFELIEGTNENPNTPYEYTVETSLYKEVFEKTVIPLAHPVGFNWNFIRLLFLNMEDYFGLEQIETLGETMLICYGNSRVELKQVEIAQSGMFGTVKSFNVIKDQDDREGLIIDYNPLDGTEGEGLRIVKEYNGRVVLYDRQSVKIVKDPETKLPTGEIQYLDIEEVKISNIQNGILTINKVKRTLLGETFEVIESIDFQEYSIIDRPYVDITYRIRGDFEGKWYSARLKFGEKTVSENLKFFNPYNFDRQSILDSSSSYNGRVVEDKGNNCLIRYKAVYTYKVSTKDKTPYVENKRPTTLHLAQNTKDIEIPYSEYISLKEEGKDPYKNLYATHDHTIEETNFYGVGDNWARLSPGNYKLTGRIGETGIKPLYNKGHIAPEKIVDEETGDINYIEDGDIVDLVIGGDWLIADNSLCSFDKGFNSNHIDGPRWENYFKPKEIDDLALLENPNSVERYIRDNTEWKTKKNSNNNFYTAWEDYNMDIEFNLFKNEKTYKHKLYDFNVEKESEYLRQFDDGVIEDEQGRPLELLETVTHGIKLGEFDIDGEAVCAVKEKKFYVTIGTLPIYGIDQQAFFDLSIGSYEHNYRTRDFDQLVDADPVNLQTKTFETIEVEMEVTELESHNLTEETNDSLEAVTQTIDAGNDLYDRIELFTEIGDFNIGKDIFYPSLNNTAPASIGWLKPVEDNLDFTMMWNLVPNQVEYCYDEFINWNLGDTGYEVGCAYIDGTPYHEEVKAEIYRAKWTYLDDKDSSHSKYESFDFTVYPIMEADFTKEDEDGIIKSAVDLNENIMDHIAHSTVDTEEYSKDEHKLKIGDFNINDTVLYASNHIKPVYIGYDNMFTDDYHFGIGFNINPYFELYTYNTFVEWKVGDERNIGTIDEDNQSILIGSLGYSEYVKADMFRQTWNEVGTGTYDKFEKVNFTPYFTANDSITEDEDGLNKTADDSSLTIINSHNFGFDNFEKDMPVFRIGDFNINGKGSYETGNTRNVLIGYYLNYQEEYNNIISWNVNHLKNNYSYNTYSNWNINEKEQLDIGSDIYIDGYAYHKEVNADVYRGQWNWRYDDISKDSREDYEYIINSEVKSISSKWNTEEKSIQDVILGLTTKEEADFGGDYVYKTNQKVQFIIGEFNIEYTEVYGETVPSFIGYEISYSDVFGFTEIRNMNPTKQEYCYNTYVEWNIGEEDLIIGCNYINGAGYSEMVKADAYRARWNWQVGEQDFNKFENIIFTQENNIIEEFGEIEVKDLVQEEKLLNDSIIDNFHNIKIGDTDLEIGGEVESDDRSHGTINFMIGFEYMLSESANTKETINLCKEEDYTQNKFLEVYIGNSDDKDDCMVIGRDIIGGYMGETFSASAELYRVDWNFHENDERHNSFDHFTCGVYRWDEDEEEWVYLEDNNIEAAS